MIMTAVIAESVDVSSVCQFPHPRIDGTWGWPIQGPCSLTQCLQLDKPIIVSYEVIEIQSISYSSQKPHH